MSTYNVHGGHNSIVPGASGYLDEVTEDRNVKNKLISYLKAAGHTVYDCTDDSGRTQSANLSNIVKKCNAHSVDLDISIHLNAGGGTGVEVLYYTSSSAGKSMAATVSEKVASALGLRNRGAKASSSLYVLKKTKATAILVECCFVDSQTDKSKWSADKCAKAIAEAVTGKTVSSSSGSSSGSTKTATSDKPSYKVGTLYTLQVDRLRVRAGAGTNYATKSYSQLTANARKNAYSNGTLKKGTKVTCKEVKTVGSDIWMRIPSGWIAAYYDGKLYIS